MILKSRTFLLNVDPLYHLLQLTTQHRATQVSIMMGTADDMQIHPEASRPLCESKPASDSIAGMIEGLQSIVGCLIIFWSECQGAVKLCI